MSITNEPAFPINDENCSIRERAGSQQFMQGLSKLEYYAGLAMQGDWASQSEAEGYFPNNVKAEILTARAQEYIRAARALIAELEKANDY